jgi:cobaltochelatase CobS
MITKIYGNEEVMGTLSIAFKKSIPALLVGQTGTGKNTILRFIAEQNERRDVIRLNLTGDTTVDDLIGHYQIKDRSTVWQDGSVTDAVRNGHILILDEVNAAQPEVLFALQSLLDDDKSLTLTSHDNSIVKAHKNFRIFATMNPTSGYAGTKSMNKAFMSRFGVVLEVEYVDPETEMSLIESLVPKVKRDDLLIMVETARVARDRLHHEQLSFPVSTRDLIFWAEMTKQVGDIAKAYNHTIVNKSDGDKKDLLEILQRSVSEKASTEEYRKNLEERINDVMKRLGSNETRSILREDADKLVVTLEKLEKIACDKEAITRDVTREVNERLESSRNDIKDIATKLKEEAHAVELKQKQIFKDGYEKGQADIYKKLGIEAPQLTKVEE